MGKPKLNKSGSSFKQNESNKRKWRLQKYSQKSKIETWKDKRKDYIVHGYRKEQNRQKNDVKFDVKKIYEEEEERTTREEEIEEDPQRKRKSVADRIREKKEEKEEFLQRKAEKEEAAKKYRKERMERNRKLNKKTKKGQPVMKGKIEYLLDKIQKSMEN